MTTNRNPQTTDHISQGRRDPATTGNRVDDGTFDGTFDDDHPFDYDDVEHFDGYREQDDDCRLPPMPCVAYDFLGPLRRFIHDDDAATRLASWLGCWYEGCADSGVLPPLAFLDHVRATILAASTSDDDLLAKEAANVIVHLLATYIDLVARSPIGDWIDPDEPDELDDPADLAGQPGSGSDGVGASGPGFGLRHPDRPGPIYAQYVRDHLVT